ncbi:MAG: Coq4 family protein [Scytonema sp. PMC 1069.18]|nr:Coq4 family protein [Scytonema sp. PMC 1069.18]MEC4883330.1 Coq4 family protein [Scytonema sp. PMC 1070.18]
MEITQAMAQVLSNSESLLNDPNFVQAFLSVAAYPYDPELAWYYKLEEVVRHLDEQQSSDFVEKLQFNPDMAEMISQHYFGPQYKLKDLQRDCPPGSLGYAYYHHMTRNGIPAYEYSAFEASDDISYIKLRKMQTHDIWHVITGYNTNIFEELALQGFYQGQTPTVYQTLLMLALVLHFATVQTKDLNTALEALFEGWHRGRTARPLWAVRWEEMWQRPLADIQAEYNITPRSVGDSHDLSTKKILSFKM